jgi:hypothetical protein
MRFACAPGFPAAGDPRTPRGWVSDGFPEARFLTKCRRKFSDLFIQKRNAALDGVRHLLPIPLQIQ